MAYCTLEQARAAGAVGTDEQVAAAIADAGRLIDAYTGTVWEPRQLELVARVESDGAVFLPYVVQSVTAVTPVGGQDPLPDGGYLVLSSRTPGQVDAIVFGGRGWANALVLGAEPWAGGYANLLRGSVTGQVTVAGTFGPEVTPPEVVDAARALAAWRTTSGSLVTAPGPVQTNDEGDSVAITLTVEQATTRSHTTGLGAVDAVLAPLIRQPIRIG